MSAIKTAADAATPFILQPWPTRMKLPSLTPEAPSLPPELVPDGLRPWLLDISERTQIPLEFVAAPAIVTLSAVVGRGVGIYPKQQDDWLVVPNLWGAIIGRPGLLKSPAISEAMKPLRRLAKEAQDSFKQSSAEVEAETQVIKMRVAARNDEGRKAAKSGDNEKLAEIQADLADLNSSMEQAAAHERRYIVNDGTVEKIGELLNQNPRGLLLARDELSGWLRNLDKAGREGDRELFLEAWNGTGGFTYDRIGRGTLHIEALTVSVLGTIQPGKLRSYITGALQGGTGDDGLLQRFQVVVWPDFDAEWKNVDRWPDTDAKNNAFGIFKALDTLDPTSIGADADGEIPALRFSLEAQEMFDEWRGILEARLRGPEIEATPAFESHLAKYRSLMPSLALLFHLVETVQGGAAPSVSLTSARMAADWCEFLETHATKIYSAELHPENPAAHSIAERIKTGAIDHEDKIRDIYRHQWLGLTKPEAVWAGLQTLERLGWLRVVSQDTGGRPSDVIDLHPDLRRTA